MSTQAPAAAQSLLHASAVRSRAQIVLARARENALGHWALDEMRLPAIADYVIETTRAAYPTLDVPFHARWRHFVVAGEDRAASYKPQPPAKLIDAKAARAAFDLAIISVLLDAGAGPHWRYESREGPVLRRSEGLAVASLDMFEEGYFAAVSDDLRRADAITLAALHVNDLEDGFHVSDNNPLAGLEGRVALLNALGRAVAARPAVFAQHDGPRPGGLYDELARRAQNNTIAAPAILEALLENFGSIWPSRLSLDGVPLGDCWRHPALDTQADAPGLMPFHKLSQWLAYSLIEPLQWAGIEVTDVDGLTGLPEYRNGGLFVDLGALTPRDPTALAATHEAGSEFIVEWRALTVALLDELARLIRQRLGMDERSLPLAKILEGGTWSAGRRIARERRPDGSPPVTIVSDGTIF
ncbi:MAG: uracil phosphoribosyltransferase [Hyphomicrobiales bacterium]|nr:uracil phosphoribosyltransferase [Hyphomicrobiales bacterium]